MLNKTILENITVVIETPKGKGHKYDYDPVTGYFKLTKMMPAGLVFPFDFGFIPGTIGGDGDPLDVLVISEMETFTGCAIDCRIIGAVKASQRERNRDQMRNDRFIAVPVVSSQYAPIQRIGDLPPGIMDELESFFINYNQQAGKSFKPLKRLSPKQAEKLIAQAKDKNDQTKLIQLFVPLYDRQGKPFPETFYKSVNKKLIKEFGGLTMYTRSPATGIWKEKGEKAEKDEILVYEVITVQVAEKFWEELKNTLEKQFRQDEILILVSSIHRI